MKKIFGLLTVIFMLSCEDKSTIGETQPIPENWQMIEVYPDEIEELNVGSYYGLFYDKDNPMKDSFLELSDDRIIAIAVEDSLVLGKSSALIWAADDKHILTLQSDSTIGRKAYCRTYSDKDFKVELKMKFWERIDGLDEEDMYIYRGKMKITANEIGNSKEYQIKGGI